MTTSPLPWSIANEHDIMDASGKIVGSFADHRDADLVIANVTKDNITLNEELEAVKGTLHMLLEEVRKAIQDLQNIL